MRRTTAAWLTRVAVAGLAGSVPALVWAAAAMAADTENVGIEAQAWYRTPADVCSAPIGCPPKPVPDAVSAYPRGTLHVEVDAGQPAAHAYLKPDLRTVSPDATPVSGRLTLPVTEGPQAGNIAVETATIVGCLVTEPITDGVEGGITTPPAYDCHQARSPAKPSKDATTFTMDLAAFLTAWHEGSPRLGIALVPAPDQAPGAGWQVTFNGKDTAATPRVSVSLTYDEHDTGGGNASPPTRSSDPVVVPGSGGPETPPLADFALGAAPESVAPPPAVTGAVPEPAALPGRQAATPIRLVNMPWYSHGGVVYLPLAFLAGIALIARTLIKPVSPRPLRMRSM